MRDAGMKTVKIFLASSVVELEHDRNAIGNFVRALRDIYDARGVKMDLYDCTYENQAMTSGRRQDEHNEHARQSDIFLALFYNKAGKFTVEEFHEAYKQLQNTGAPAILVCFREGEGYAPKDSLLAFRDELEDELEQHPIIYTDIDSVSLKVLLQMQRMNLDVPIEVEESMITVDGTPVLTLENIPMWAKNTDFQSLKQQFQACEQEYLDAMVNKADVQVLARAKKKRDEIRDALNQLEQELFSIAIDMDRQENDGSLTMRQRVADKLMAQGDSQSANMVLSTQDIEKDIDRTDALAQHTDKQYEQYVQEYLQKIRILKTMVRDPSRFDQIEACFEKAVALEKRRNLKKIAMREYVSYLHNQNNYKDAIPLAELYWKYVELDGDKSQIADAANILGNLYSDTDCMELAERRFLQAKEIYEQLVDQNPSAYQPDLAGTCNNLGTLYQDTNRMDKAEREYLRANEIYEQLAAENPSAYQPNLATSCNNLGNLYADTNRLELAEQEHLRANEIYEQLAAQHPSAYQPYLAISCNNLGALYQDTNCMDKAEREYLRAKEIREQLAAENPSAYQPDLAMSCSNLGILYAGTNRMDKAEQEYLRAKEIREQLAADNPSVYQPNLAKSCNNLGILYAGTNRMDKAEQEYLRAKEIREQLAADNPSVYQPNLAKSCNNLGILYAGTNRMDKAEQEYLRAKKIREQLVAEHPSVYRQDLASTCNNLGVLYYTSNRLDKAEQELLRAKELYEQLTALAPAQYASTLAAICANLGKLYEDTDRPEQAKRAAFPIILGVLRVFSLSKKISKNPLVSYRKGTRRNQYEIPCERLFGGIGFSCGAAAGGVYVDACRTSSARSGCAHGVCTYCAQRCFLSGVHEPVGRLRRNSCHDAAAVASAAGADFPCVQAVRAHHTLGADAAGAGVCGGVFLHAL